MKKYFVRKNIFILGFLFIISTAWGSNRLNVYEGKYRFVDIGKKTFTIEHFNHNLDHFIRLKVYEKSNKKTLIGEYIYHSFISDKDILDFLLVEKTKDLPTKVKFHNRLVISWSDHFSLNQFQFCNFGYNCNPIKMKRINLPKSADEDITFLHPRNREFMYLNPGRRVMSRNAERFGSQILLIQNEELIHLISNKNNLGFNLYLRHTNNWQSNNYQVIIYNDNEELTLKQLRNNWMKSKSYLEKLLKSKGKSITVLDSYLLNLLTQNEIELYFMERLKPRSLFLSEEPYAIIRNGVNFTPTKYGEYKSSIAEEKQLKELEEYKAYLRKESRENAVKNLAIAYLLEKGRQLSNEQNNYIIQLVTTYGRNVLVRESLTVLLPELSKSEIGYLTRLLPLLVAGTTNLDSYAENGILELVYQTSLKEYPEYDLPVNAANLFVSIILQKKSLTRN